MTNPTRRPEAKPVVIVLGAAGFIGRNVCRELAIRGFRVKGLGHGNLNEPTQQMWGIGEWLDADISMSSLAEIASSEPISVIAHCAGSGAVANSYRAPAQDYDRSVSTTLAMLEFARTQATPPKIVMASSAAVYGDQGDRDIDESATLKPVSPYGYHKVMSENLCESYSRFFDVPVTLVRLFSVYGEGLQKQLLWDALNKFSRGEFKFFGTGDELRDWIHVDDAARLIGLAATTDTGAYAVVNGGNEKATTRKLLSAMATEFGAHREVIFTGETHTGNPRRLTASVARAKELLHFGPRVSLTEGLKRYTSWFKKMAPQ